MNDKEYLGALVMAALEWEMRASGCHGISLASCVGLLAGHRVSGVIAALETLLTALNIPLPERGGWTVLTDDPASCPSREYGEVFLTVYDKNTHQRDVWEAYWVAPYTIEADPDDPTTPYVWPGGWEYGDEGFELPEQFVPIAWMPKPELPEPYQEAKP